MKKLFSKPECEVIRFSQSDVLATVSPFCSDPSDHKYWEAVGGYADSDICFEGEFSGSDPQCEE